MKWIFRACMTHTCTKCGFMIFNNDLDQPEKCSLCGAPMHPVFDEQD